MKAIVIIARGLHLGYVGCYGNEWIETATLDRLASEGVVFDQHYADSPDSVGACHAWRTGQYRVPIPGDKAGPAASAEMDLLSLLRQQKINTFLVVEDSKSVPEDYSLGWEKVIRIHRSHTGGSTLERTLDAACEALDKLRKRTNWLLWIDLATLMPPWEVPDDYLKPYFENEAGEDDDDQADQGELPLTEDEAMTALFDPRPGLLAPDDEVTFSRLQSTYAAAVGYLDAGLDLLWEELQKRGLLEEVLLMVTTDRGQALGEHGIIGDYCPWLHEELVHLPLLVRFPGKENAGLRLAALSQSVDLMPTLLDWFSVSIPATIHGHNLLPLIRGEVQQVHSHAYSGLRMGETIEWAVRTAEWAFLLPVHFAVDDRPRPPQLFVKPDDRWEVNDVLKHNMEVAEQLEGTLRGFVEETRRQGD